MTDATEMDLGRFILSRKWGLSMIRTKLIQPKKESVLNIRNA